MTCGASRQKKGAGSPSPSSSRNLRCAMPSQKLLAPIQDSYGKRPHDLELRLRRIDVPSNPKRPDESVQPLSNLSRARKPCQECGPLRCWPQSPYSSFSA